MFLEEERERELEAAYTAEVNNEPRASGGEGDDLDGDTAVEAEAVQKQTADTLMAGEKIMEAIELADAERENINTGRKSMTSLVQRRVRLCQSQRGARS